MVVRYRTLKRKKQEDLSFCQPLGIWAGPERAGALPLDPSTHRRWVADGVRYRVLLPKDTREKEAGKEPQGKKEFFIFMLRSSGWFFFLNIWNRMDEDVKKRNTEQE